MRHSRPYPRSPFLPGGPPDGVAEVFLRAVGVSRRRAEVFMAQQLLDQEHIAGPPDVRGGVVAQIVRRPSV